MSSKEDSNDSQTLGTIGDTKRALKRYLSKVRKNESPVTLGFVYGVLKVLQLQSYASFTTDTSCSDDEALQLLISLLKYAAEKIIDMFSKVEMEPDTQYVIKRIKKNMRLIKEDIEEPEKNLPLAVCSLMFVLERAYNDIETMRTKVTGLVRMGDKYLKCSAYKCAEQVYKRASEIVFQLEYNSNTDALGGDTNTLAPIGLGNAMLAQGKFTQAGEYITKGMALSPSFVAFDSDLTSNLNIPQMYANKLEQIADDQAAPVQELILLGYMYYFTNNASKAGKVFSRCLKADDPYKSVAETFLNALSARKSQVIARAPGSWADSTARDINDPEALSNIVQRMLDPVTGVNIADRDYRGKTYMSTFIGSELVSWLMKALQLTYRKGGQILGQQIMDKGMFQHSAKARGFDDGYFFYNFTKAAIAGDSVREGYMYRKGTCNLNLFTKWHKRYFILKKNRLAWVVDDIVKFIPIHNGFALHRLDAEKKDFPFEVLFGASVVVLAAESNKDRDEWFEALQQVQTKYLGFTTNVS